MEDDCEEIYTGGLLKRYSKRPARFEHLTLADWAAWYDSCAKLYLKQSIELDTDNLPVETSINNDDDHYDDDMSDFSNKVTPKTKKRTKARIIRSFWFNQEADLEKHYHELIMLFTPRRNKKSDLIGSCSSYKEQYMLLSNAIGKQMEEYAICKEDFDEIQQDTYSVDNSYGTIAPCTQSVELQDETP